MRNAPDYAKSAHVGAMSSDADAQPISPPPDAPGPPTASASVPPSGEPRRPRSLGEAVPSVKRLVCFQSFNAISFQIALGPPLILMARHWGASPFYIGAITGLVPLLSILQVYTAPRLEYLGFRRVMLSGWTGRNITLIGVAALPFSAWLSGGRIPTLYLLEALFAFMFVYNLLRGLASASWLPWISYLVPAEWRGRFISIDQFVIYTSSAAALFFCGWLVGEEPTDLRFGILWLVSLGGGWISLYFLRRVDSPPPREGKPHIEPWYVWAGKVWQKRSPRRLIRMNIAWSLAMAAWGTFTIVFLRDSLHYGDRTIMNIVGASTLGGVASAWVWGRLADRFGSRPVLALSTRLVLLVMIGWLLIAMGQLYGSPLVVTTLYVLLGMASLGFNVGNARYLFNNAPREFPVLAITLFSVITSLANAIAPMLWGTFLRGLEGQSHAWGPLIFTRFTWFYLLTICVVLICKVLIRRLPDREAVATSVVVYSIFSDIPMRGLNMVYHSMFGNRRLSDLFRSK